ncbi:MAG: O-antigen ligase family protein [Rhodocyclaceae bacterium]|nr:O-antigen ligase family protein [Rhodocyclaceae bacterium]
MSAVPPTAAYWANARGGIGRWLAFGVGLLLLQAVLVFFIVFAPALAVYLGRYVLLALLLVVLVRLSPAGAPFWLRAVLLVVLGEFVLNYGFSNFSVGVGAARATVAELVLLLSLLWLAVQRWSALWLLPGSALLILLYAVPPMVVHFPADVMRHGLTAARDALPLVDSLFFFAGVAAVAAAPGRDVWRTWRHRFLWLLLLSSALYLPWHPVQDTLLSLSPRVTGYQQSVPLVGYYATGNVLALAGLLAVVLIPAAFSWRGERSPGRLALAALFMVFALGVVITQSRTTYLLTGFALLFLGFCGHGRAVRSMLLAFLVLVGALAIVDVAGVEVEGRVGKLGLEMVTRQLESVTGEGGLESGREGVDQRKVWIKDSLSRWAGDTQSMLVGIGFGTPLTDFRVLGAERQSVIVREPHNSLVSVLTRTGLLGAIPWCLFHMALMLGVWRHGRTLRKAGERTEADYWLWMLLLFLSVQVSALVQPAFESPHFAVPYFFLAGMCLAEIARTRAAWRALPQRGRGRRG